jgi:tRNA A-37 threonylcarbamoyl transferase component Bud32
MSEADRQPPGTCPGRDDLTAFHVGNLSAAELERIAGHLRDCPHCADTLDGLSDTADPFVAELRRPVPPSALSEAERKRSAALAQRAGCEVTTSFPGHEPTGVAPPAAPGPQPASLGQYDLLKKLGEGGMGQVFKARHRLMNRVVALKVIHKRHLDRPGAVERFRREIRTLAQLGHPNIVGAQYADQVGDTHFLVMEFVEGVTLAQLVRERGPLPVPLACAYARQAAEALQHAHEHGLVHRDVKPANLMLTLTGQVKLLDLGLARLREEQPAGEDLTGAGAVLGTPDYMAPEQWDDTHAVDVRADIYSLGCTLYHLLTGRPPFGGPEYSSSARKMKAHAEAPVPPVRGLRPDVPEGLAAVLGRLLAKDPADRYATPAEVSAALAAYAGETGGGQTAAPAPAALPGRPAPRRRSWLLRGAAIVIAVCLAGLALLAVIRYRGGPPSAPPPTGTAGVGPAVAPGAGVRVVSLQVKHFRGDPPAYLGDLGDTSSSARYDDDVRVEARLSEPGYGYLIAFNPDGKEQLCLPKEGAVPGQNAALSYPDGANRYFGLNDDVGLQAFVLVAGRQPLPAYAEWRGAAAAPWRKNVEAGGVWRFDGRGFELLGPVVRGMERQRGGPPEPLVELCNFFKDRSGADAVAAVAFPVNPKKRP